MATDIVDDGTTAMSGRHGPLGTDETGETGATSSLHVFVLSRAAHLLPDASGFWRDYTCQWLPWKILQENLFALDRSVKEVLHVSVG